MKRPPPEPPPAPEQYVLEPHRTGSGSQCPGPLAGQPRLTRWKANPGGWHFGMTPMGFCPACGVWHGLVKRPETL